jgi:hypothetical protein
MDALANVMQLADAVALPQLSAAAQAYVSLSSVPLPHAYLPAACLWRLCLRSAECVLCECVLCQDGILNYPPFCFARLPSLHLS